MALALAALAAPAAASAEVWTIDTSIINNTASGMSNCPSSAPGTSCIFVQGTPSLSSDGVWSDGSSYPSNQPWGAIAGSWGSWDGTDTWTYYAPYFGYGADAYATYAMPDGSLYYVTIEDDLDGSIGTTAGANMYAACVAGQPSSPYVCSPDSGNLQASDFDPSITFSPSATAPAMAAGQVCSGTVAGGQSIDCIGTGQWTRAHSLTVIYFANFGTSAATVTDTTIDDSRGTCTVPPQTSSTTVSTCVIETQNYGDGFTISPADPNAPPTELDVQVYALSPVSGLAGAFGQLLNGMWGSLGGGDDGGGEDVAAALARAAGATPTSTPNVFTVHYPRASLTPPKGRHHTKTVDPPKRVRDRIARAYGAVATRPAS